MNKRYKSNVSWTAICPSCDYHTTRQEAKNVCDILIRDYGKEPGCDIRGVCTHAWVTVEDYEGI